ncbi:hypothetical protein GE09DRAFT_1180596 [Coniochaeta sp. 2T2.1]|nr:hypothetical protein GE09DRAFT_1180596 [Coniochaeta sp. 2T2.1]
MVAPQEKVMRHSDTSFGATTEGKEVVEAFKDHVAGKNILITGVLTEGLGAELAKTLLPYKPALLILASAKVTDVGNLIVNLRTLQANESDTAIVPLHLDLSSFESVRKAAGELTVYLSQRRDAAKLDVLFNNASPEGIRAYSRALDGYETLMGVVHLGHFLLTGLLRSSLAPAARVVNLSSTHQREAEVKISDPVSRPGEAAGPDGRHERAVSAPILFTKGLARRGFVSFAVYPGPRGSATGANASPPVAPDFLAERFGLGWKSFQQAVATHLVAGFQPGLEKTHNGALLSDCQVEETGAWAESEMTVNGFWEWSEERVGQQFP